LVVPFVIGPFIAFLPGGPNWRRTMANVPAQVGCAKPLTILADQRTADPVHRTAMWRITAISGFAPCLVPSMRPHRHVTAR
jgi:hypothetical protein